MDTYSQKGQHCLNDLASALRTGQRPLKDYVFISIDFEGDVLRGVKELGISSFETKRLFDNAGRLSIHNDHYALSRNSRKSIFSATTRITTDLLPQVLREILDSHANVVLVGHSLWYAEINLMESYGLGVEHFSNIVGESELWVQPFFSTRKH